MPPRYPRILRPASSHVQDLALSSRREGYIAYPAATLIVPRSHCPYRQTCRHVTNTRQTLYIRPLTAKRKSHLNMCTRFEEDNMIACSVNQCDCCHSPIASGQRWVRQKIYDPALNGRDPSYHHYHAEPFAGQETSCWEKHLIELARTNACAA
jgi:hypothetical protein